MNRSRIQIKEGTNLHKIDSVSKASKYTENEIVYLDEHTKLLMYTASRDFDERVFAAVCDVYQENISEFNINGISFRQKDGYSLEVLIQLATTLLAADTKVSVRKKSRWNPLAYKIYETTEFKNKHGKVLTFEVAEREVKHVKPNRDIQNFLKIKS